MDNTAEYTRIEKKGFFGNKEITENDFYPVFSSDDDRMNAKQNIEQGLYKIFSKYCTNPT